MKRLLSRTSLGAAVVAVGSLSLLLSAGCAEKPGKKKDDKKGDKAKKDGKKADKDAKKDAKKDDKAKKE